MLEKDAWEQLIALRDLSNKTQTLHEAQVLQLRLWPILALPQAKETAGQVDLNWLSSSIQFSMFKKRGLRAPKNQQDRLKKLDEAVKELLGSWWTVQVLLDKKVIYNGKATGTQHSNLAAALRLKTRANKDLLKSQGESSLLDSSPKQSA